VAPNRDSLGWRRGLERGHHIPTKGDRIEQTNLGSDARESFGTRINSRCWWNGMTVGRAVFASAATAFGFLRMLSSGRQADRLPNGTRGWFDVRREAGTAPEWEECGL
jgi:hypothetical protein